MTTTTETFTVRINQTEKEAVLNGFNWFMSGPSHVGSDYYRMQEEIVQGVQHLGDSRSEQLELSPQVAEVFLSTLDALQDNQPGPGYRLRQAERKLMVKLSKLLAQTGSDYEVVFTGNATPTPVANMHHGIWAD